MAVTVHINKRQIKSIQRRLGNVKKMPRVAAAAINETARKARTRVVNTLHRRLNMKKGVIRNKVPITVKATRTRLFASINIAARRPGLIRFGAKQTAKGVSYKMNRSGSRKKIEGAFIATSKKGKNVWIRVAALGSKAKKFKNNRQRRRVAGRMKQLAAMAMLPRKYRLPIMRLMGPSLGRVYIAERMDRNERRQITMDLNKAFKSKIDWMLKKE